MARGYGEVCVKTVLAVGVGWGHVTTPRTPSTMTSAASGNSSAASILFPFYLLRVTGTYVTATTSEDDNSSVTTSATPSTATMSAGSRHA